MDTTITERPAMRLAAIAHRGPYQHIGPVFDRLAETARAAGLLARATGPAVAIYKDDPTSTPPVDLRSAAALPISEHESIPAGLIEERLAAGKFLRAMHVGPYDRLPDAWTKMRDMFRASGHRRRTGPSLDVYLDDPTTVEPAELRTEILVPIE